MVIENQNRKKTKCVTTIVNISMIMMDDNLILFNRKRMQHEEEEENCKKTLIIMYEHKIWNQLENQNRTEKKKINETITNATAYL